MLYAIFRVKLFLMECPAWKERKRKKAKKPQEQCIMRISSQFFYCCFFVHPSHHLDVSFYSVHIIFALILLYFFFIFRLHQHREDGERKNALETEKSVTNGATHTQAEIRVFGKWQISRLNFNLHIKTM